MQADELISVIVPCLNNGTTIRECVESLLEQEHSNYELIFVDNGSTDSTVTILQEYPVKLLFEKIKNPYISRNLGASNASGSILVFTDANCFIDSKWLPSIASMMARGYHLSQGPGHLTYQNGLIPEAESKRLQMTPDNFWGDAKNLAIKKETFDELGGFPEYPTGSDSSLLDRCMYKGFSVVYNPEQQVYRSFSTGFFRMAKKSWKYGKADVMIDIFRNKLHRRRKLRNMVGEIRRSFKKVLKAPGVRPALIEIYIFFMLEIRYLSYYVNYSSVIEEYESLSSNDTIC